uniref:Gustatory receptor n=1 Tax=Phlebotomus papatasi TaxID=29031 RepID=A0A3F2ZEI6_PHLPP
MELVEVFNPYFNVFRIFGICLQTPGMSHCEKILSYIFSIIGLICVTVLSTIQYYNNNPATGKDILNYIQGICLHITHFVVIIETLFTQKQQLQFWYYLQKLEGYFKKDLEYAQRCYITCKRNVIKKFWLLTGFSILIETSLFTLLYIFDKTQEKSIEDLQSWCLLILGVIVGRFRHLSHIFVIDILKVHIEIFNNSLAKLSRKNFKNFHKESIIEELNFIKFRHTYIWEICRNINLSHFWSQICNIFINFLQLTCICYYIYYHIVFRQFKIIAHTFLLHLPILSHLYILMQSSENLQIEAQKSSTFLHSLLRKSSKDVSPLLKNYIMDLSLQMHHEKINIGFGRIFTLNIAFMCGMIGTIATYFVIAIQFF